MKKAIIFDMDGTLLNTLTDLTRSVNFALQKMGYASRREDEISLFIGNGVANLIRCAVPKGAGEENVMQTLKFFTEHYAHNSQVDTRPYPGVLKLLNKLHSRGYFTAIVSNKFDGTVKELNLRWFKVNVAIGESAALRRKPAPDMLLAALSELGIKNTEAIYIGDTEVDLQTAQNAGCAPILVSWGYRKEADLRAIGGCGVASSAEELLTLIEALKY